MRKEFQTFVPGVRMYCPECKKVVSPLLEFGMCCNDGNEAVLKDVKFICSESNRHTIIERNVEQTDKPHKTYQRMLIIGEITGCSRSQTR